MQDIKSILEKFLEEASKYKAIPDKMITLREDGDAFVERLSTLAPMINTLKGENITKDPELRKILNKAYILLETTEKTIRKTIKQIDKYADPLNLAIHKITKQVAEEIAEETKEVFKVTKK